MRYLEAKAVFVWALIAGLSFAGGLATAGRYEYFVMDGYVMRYDTETGDACAISDAMDPHQTFTVAGKILCGKP